MTDGRRRFPYVALAVATPTVTSALGIDGGAIFQIAAVEDLGLDPRAIGTAFGLGVLSVPLQLWAARLPLWRARRNLCLFLAFAAGGCWLMALLLAVVEQGTTPVVIALVLTVAAEIALSVLYATSWQPLLAHGLPSDVRQRLNARGRAAGGVLLALTLIGFAAAGRSGRVALLGLAGVVAVALAVAARGMAVPARPSVEPEGPITHVPRARLPHGLGTIYVALGAAAFATWPLFLVYVRQVLWPSANLGVVGAVQLAGSLVAALAWRSDGGDVRRRATSAAGGLTAGALVLAGIRGSVSGPVEAAAVLGAAALAAGSTTTLFLALLESAHRSVDDRSAVKALTIYDVVASTSFQAALFVGGFVVAAATSRSAWLLDPYRIYLLAAAAAVIGAVHRLGPAGDHLSERTHVR